MSGTRARTQPSSRATNFQGDAGYSLGLAWSGLLQEGESELPDQGLQLLPHSPLSVLESPPPPLSSAHLSPSPPPSKHTMTAPRSAREFEKQLVGLAYSGVGKEPPAKSQSPDVPLVPIYVGIDTDQPPQQLREVGCGCLRPSQHLMLLTVLPVAAVVCPPPPHTDVSVPAWRYVPPALGSIQGMI